MAWTTRPQHGGEASNTPHTDAKARHVYCLYEFPRASYGFVLLLIRICELRFWLCKLGIWPFAKQHTVSKLLRAWKTQPCMCVFVCVCFSYLFKYIASICTLICMHIYIHILTRVDAWCWELSTLSLSKSRKQNEQNLFRWGLEGFGDGWLRKW